MVSSKSLIRVAALGAAVFLLPLFAPVSGAAAAASPTGIANRNVRVCAIPVAGQVACDAIRHERGTAQGHGHKPGPAAPTVSYNAAQLQHAYALTTASDKDGAGTTVAIVDAYSDPNALTDVNTYRTDNSLKGITGCSTSNPANSTTTAPCLSILNEAGAQGPLPSPNAGWAEEISVDLDIVSAICPNCNIALVEASSTSFTDLGKAVDTAAALKPAAISNSYGGSEFASEATYAKAYYEHSGIAITASSGDNGYGVEFPAAGADVIAVGGTSLQEDSSGRWLETVWSGAGSGCSADIPKPQWQTDTGCANRTVADVAAVADPNTGVQVFDSYQEPGLMVFGGTSVSAQIVAGVYALAGGGVDSAKGLYTATSGTANSSLRDVTSGSNGNCAGHGHQSLLAYLCTGEDGYDGPTGMGTPQGTGGF